ncbi:MAG: hypothetical protein HDQ92_02375 [Desulfovibrio sp.]|nr:hypothetical protein [Desulfovibrio sp.]
MLGQQKISLGRVRQAYRLTSNEVETIIQALWPHAVFPVELWHRAHEAYWKDFAHSNQTIYNREIPVLPQPCSQEKRLHTYLFGCDIMDFFRELSMTLPVNPLYQGLKYILAESYEEINTIFPGERQTLFDSLRRLDTADFASQYEADSPLREKALFAIPASMYHFISQIFVDTILVNREVAIRFLRDYPLSVEVKGITRVLVESILTKAAPKIPAPEIPDSQADSCVVEEAEDGRLIFRIPAAVWKGKPDHAVHAAMKDIYPPAVIAHVLFYWCAPKPEAGHKIRAGRKTRLGRLFTQKEYSDPKSYRNLFNVLLEEADTYTIIEG